MDKQVKGGDYNRFTMNHNNNMKENLVNGTGMLTKIPEMMTMMQNHHQKSSKRQQQQQQQQQSAEYNHYPRTILPLNIVSGSFPKVHIKPKDFKQKLVALENLQESIAFTQTCMSDCHKALDDVKDLLGDDFDQDDILNSTSIIYSKTGIIPGENSLMTPMNLSAISSASTSLRNRGLESRVTWVDDALSTSGIHSRKSQKFQNKFLGSIQSSNHPVTTFGSPIVSKSLNVGEVLDVMVSPFDDKEDEDDDNHNNNNNDDDNDDEEDIVHNENELTDYRILQQQRIENQQTLEHPTIPTTAAVLPISTSRRLAEYFQHTTNKKDENEEEEEEDDDDDHDHDDDVSYERDSQYGDTDPFYENEGLRLSLENDEWDDDDDPGFTYLPVPMTDITTIDLEDNFWGTTTNEDVVVLGTESTSLLSNFDEIENQQRRLSSLGGIPEITTTTSNNNNNNNNSNSHGPMRPIIPKEDLESISLRIVYESRKTGLQDSKDFIPTMGEVVAGRYQVEEKIGEAVFSTAFRCIDLDRGSFNNSTKQQQQNNNNNNIDSLNELVCLKVIKNEKTFFDQGIDEIKLLRCIHRHSAGQEENYIVRLMDYFYFKEHICIVTELLGENLYEFSNLCREQGENFFNVNNLRIISKQILTALKFIHSIGIVHCDLKPENILIQDANTVRVKLIDFGSGCFTSETCSSSYIQSRAYRAPEILLGCSFDAKIDIWSLGCVLAELFTGKVLFHGRSIPSMLARIVGMLGPFPERMIRKGKNSNLYFMGVPVDASSEAGSTSSLNEIESLIYESDESGNTVIVRPKKTNLMARLRGTLSMVNFVNRLLTIDPAVRPSAELALEDPYLADTL